MSLLAHQGGWDEILLVVGPIGLIAGLLMLVRKRLNDSLGDSEPAEPYGDRSMSAPSDAKRPTKSS